MRYIRRTAVVVAATAILSLTLVGISVAGHDSAVTSLSGCLTPGAAGAAGAASAELLPLVYQQLRALARELTRLVEVPATALLVLRWAAVVVDGIVMAPFGAGADVRTGSRQRLPRPLHRRGAVPRPRARNRGRT